MPRTSYPGRLAIAAAGALAAIWLVRPWLSLQLTVSGNDALSVDPALARRLYDRALWLDPRDRFAAEGWMLATAQLRTRKSDRLALRFADRYLEVDPQAIEIRRLRGIAALHAGRRDLAVADLVAVARLRGAASDWAFARAAARIRR